MRMSNLMILALALSTTGTIAALAAENSQAFEKIERQSRADRERRQVDQMHSERDRMRDIADQATRNSWPTYRGYRTGDEEFMRALGGARGYAQRREAGYQGRQFQGQSLDRELERERPYRYMKRMKPMRKRSR